ncbi:YdcF family protein [Azoarcus sp. CIB]|uniref:YdcF family protein n=1 Tax=Aromatoleum sp. (strain CIB) TaxID=198107 RepID=UPI00067B2F9D|nr:YdcF family protein [Azoarcus sp. CIB]
MAFDSALALFWLKKTVSIMVQPPVAPLLLIAVGLLLAARWRRGGFALAWAGVVATLLLSTPASVGWLLNGLETAPVVDAAAMREAQAIVVLGAGKRRHAPEYGGETVNRLALERLRYAARLARRTGLPVLVSGGAPTGDVPEAVLMQATLEEDFRVPVRWVERASLDTQQNALFSAVPLRAAGVRRILLVTHAAHMPRAQAAFEDAGLQVIPAPTAWLGGTGAGDQVLGELPGPTSAYAGWYAVHEWLGLLAYRLTR